MTLAQQDEVDYHFGTEDLFEENVLLRDDKKDEGEDSGEDDQLDDSYPNIKSAGGYLIKTGC